MSMNSLKRENQNISLFSAGMLISVLGSAVYTFTMGLYVLKLTNSGMNFAITLMSGIMATLIFNPIAGVITDRFDKKKLIIIMDLLNGIMFVVLFLIAKYSNLSLLLIYLSAFLTTGLTTIFQIAFETVKPRLVNDDSLIKINAVSKVVDSIGRIGGPVIGGMVFALVDINLFILINGISFFISVLFESRIDFNFNKKSIANSKNSFNFIEELQEGIKYIKSNQDLSTTIYLLTAMNFLMCLSIAVPLPYILNQVLQLEPKVYGIVESFFPIGIMIGAGATNYVMKKFKYLKPPKSAQITLPLVLIAIGIPVFNDFITFSAMGYLIYYSTLMFIIGVAASFIEIPIIYYLQTEVPDELRGRVISISIMGAGIINPIALILSGVLLDKLPSYALPIFGGIIAIILLSYLNTRQSYVYQSAK